MILRGDCVEVMAGMDAGSVDAIVTDPPYGLGFMGKEWDALPPGQDWAEQCLRVLKPGGHLLAFGGTRTYHRLTVAVEDAGFEIRDCLSWLYGSGFPKSHNLKGDWEGFGTALKPSWEPIIMARKPLEGTVAANVLAHGVGALNIDGCRVGYRSDEKVQTKWNNRGSATINAGEGVGQSPPTGEDAYDPSKGRWPANVVLDEDAAAILDEQHGEARSAGNYTKGSRGPLGDMDGAASIPIDGLTSSQYADSGGPSRFFYVAKASRKERNAGLEGFEERSAIKMDGGSFKSASTEATARVAANTHPTVKPINLMRWLVRMVTPPGGTVLDPFTGSGTTGCAAVLEGFDFIGIEREPDYADIAEARIKHWTPDQLELA